MDRSEVELLEKHWNLLEDKKFNELYTMLYNNSNMIEHGFSKTLLSVGINPLDYFEESIPNYAFYQNNLADLDLVISERITKIEGYAFCRCECNSIKLPSTLIRIEYRSFSGFKSQIPIEIPDSVEFIGNDAFYSSSIPNSIVIPKSCTGVDYDAFRDNPGVTSVEVKNPNCVLGEYCFKFSGDLSNLQSAILPAKYKTAMELRRIFGYKNTLELRRRVKFTWV